MFTHKSAKNGTRYYTYRIKQMLLYFPVLYPGIPADTAVKSA